MTWGLRGGDKHSQGVEAVLPVHVAFLLSTFTVTHTCGQLRFTSMGLVRNHVPHTSESTQ